MKVVNNFILERFCGKNARKYGNKYKDLIEKALYKDQAWYKLREHHSKVVDREFEVIQNTKIPESIKKSAFELYSHFKRFLEI